MNKKPLVPGWAGTRGPDLNGYRKPSVIRATLGQGDGGFWIVTGEGELPLEPSLRVANHSPTGFEWAYRGSGPHQLALALLLDAGIEPGEARRIHGDFVTEVVSRLAPAGWILSRAEVVRFADAKRLDPGQPKERTE